ncbi:MAG TPA: tetratricopeptide repeat protein [Caulobacteraceae bacterium]|nr:tetratricopeptide repeat protein [Caulobacteraceae bacterium]
MKARYGATAIALPLLLCACASGVGTSATAPAQGAATADEAHASSYGLFLAGQAAINRGHGAQAAHFFDEAASADRKSSLLRAEAFTAALLAGQVRQAAEMAPVSGPDAEGVRPLADLTRGVEAMAEGRARAAEKILAVPQGGTDGEPAAALLAPFAAAQAGDKVGAVTRPQFTADPIDQFQADIDQGVLFEETGRYPEAETAFRALIARGDPGGEASLELGALLERRGRQAEAIAIYDEALRRSPNSLVQTARARAAGRGAPPPMPTIRQASAKAMLAPAAALLVHRQQEAALACLRLSLRLDPGLDDAWIMVGDILNTAGDTDAARVAYGQPKPSSTEYATARAKLAWSYQNAGDKAQALKIAQQAAAATNAEDAQLTLADLERVDGDNANSIAILDKLIAQKAGQAEWRLLYMRAAAYQAADRWPEAEQDLQAALKLSPDEPELLNFLGYSWIDRGEKLKEGLAMVQRAVDQDPQSGAMMDSLGWAYYHLGNYPAAVEKLEMAAALDAADPEVNDHLGDAYWKVGRKTEAIYQWRQVLTLSPNPKLKAEVEAKLKSGPDDRMAPADLTGS